MNIEQTIRDEITDLRNQKSRQVSKNKGKKWWPWADKVAGQRKVDELSKRIFELNNSLEQVRKAKAAIR